MKSWLRSTLVTDWTVGYVAPFGDCYGNFRLNSGCFSSVRENNGTETAWNFAQFSSAGRSNWQRQHLSRLVLLQHMEGASLLHCQEAIFLIPLLHQPFLAPQCWQAQSFPEDTWISMQLPFLYLKMPEPSAECWFWMQHPLFWGGIYAVAWAKNVTSPLMVLELALEEQTSFFFEVTYKFIICSTLLQEKMWEHYLVLV